MKKHFPYILTIIILTFFTWHKVCFQTFMGEGYYYFNNTFFYDPEGQRSIVGNLLGHDTGARLIFDILPKFFGDNLLFYMLLMLVIASLVNSLYYFLVYTLTEKRIIALMASVFFAVNYVTLYEMLGSGNYHNLVQRIINLIFVFLSFLLLVRFFKKKRGKFSYFGSVSLYWLAVLFSQFSIFLLPLFVAYAFTFWIGRKRSWKEFLLKFSLILPLVVVPLILLQLDILYGYSMIANKSFFNYIFRNPELITNIAYQLPFTIFPLPILRWFTEPHVRENMILLSIPTILFYLAVTYYLYRREVGLRAIVLSVPLFIPINLFLNAYTRPSQVYRIYDVSRYLYIPSIATSLFLAVLLYSIFYKRKMIGKLLLLGLMGWWIFFNLNLIWTNMNEKQKEHVAAKRTLKYIKEKSWEYPEDAFVVLPRIIGYHGANFCYKFYGREAMRFIPITAEWEKELDKDFDLEKLFILDYDAERKTLIDRSQEFRELIKTNQPIKDEVKVKYGY